MYNLNGKTAIVTGASSGIGESTAKMYAEYGANVIVADINEELGNRVVEDINKSFGGLAFFVKADVSNPIDCENMVKVAIEQYGSLSFACNNAGIGGELNPTADYSLDGWKKVIDINLNGVFYCMKYQIPEIIKSGGGAIVNVSSILGAVGFAGAPAYVAAKHGLVGLTKVAALEYSSLGVRVNSIGPAFINTPMLSALDSDTLNFLTTQHPIGRIGEPNEVAELVLWLSSEKSSFVTGSYFPVDGGYLAK